MSGTSEASFFGDVGEGAVAIIVVKLGTQGMGRLVSVGFAGLHEEQIHQAVLVVVQPSDAGAHGLEIILFFALRGVFEKSDSGVFSDVGIPDADARVLRFRRLPSKGLLMEGNDQRRGQRQDCAPHAYEEPSPACLRFFPHSKLVSKVFVLSAAGYHAPNIDEALNAF